MPQGKCNVCEIVYEWGPTPPLKRAWCPVHRNTRLQRTTHLNRWPRKRIARPVTKGLLVS